jgi:2,5-dichloro-2,5-cyclohexadiene-1,4-diol dehydrogenase 1
MDAYGKLGMQGRVVTVTGGASGIGAASARLLGARGALVVVADIDDQQGEKVVGEIRNAGGKASYLHVDVSDEVQVQGLVEFAVRTYGGLHGAFNNAGMTSRGTPLVEKSLAEWRQIVDVNLTSVFLCLKHQVGHMLKNGGGAIVNTSSGAGVVGFPHVIDYVATKHGVVGLTRAAAADYSAQGIRVNAILPGGIDTPMLMAAMGQDPVVRSAVERGHPIQRLGSAAEIGEAAAWLLSDAASFVTGSIFAVDGGYTAV